MTETAGQTLIEFRYIGGGGYLPGIPARDLSAEEVARLPMTEQELVASGLYEKVEDKVVRWRYGDESAAEGAG